MVAMVGFLGLLLAFLVEPVCRLSLALLDLSFGLVAAAVDGKTNGEVWLILALKRELGQQ